ncbi:MAG: hypothetical protein IJC48_06725 [Clostridia bacterium]|nr:hypothetical protein [Clostridia bacterium]
MNSNTVEVKKGNYILGVIGAIIGLIPGMILFVAFVSMTNTALRPISILTGFLPGVLYNACGGRRGNFKKLFIIFMVLFSGVLTVAVAEYAVAVKVLMDESGCKLGEALEYMRVLGIADELYRDSGVIGEIAKEGFFATVFAYVGVGLSFLIDRNKERKLAQANMPYETEEEENHVDLSSIHSMHVKNDDQEQ